MEEKSIFANIDFQNPDESFDKAIEEGRLSADRDAANYAGNYMYMGHVEGVAQFKHIDTRIYLGRD
jgi:hypothetical protein